MPFAPFIGASPSRRQIPHHHPKVKNFQPRIVHDARELNTSSCISLSTKLLLSNYSTRLVSVAQVRVHIPGLLLLPLLRWLNVTFTYHAPLLGLIKYNAWYFLAIIRGVPSGSIFCLADAVFIINHISLTTMCNTISIDLVLCYRVLYNMLSPKTCVL